jgi:hypothetical protein
MSNELNQNKDKSKADCVRAILAQIGAIKAHPPEGWHKKTEELLAKSNIKVHTTHIYAIRNALLRKRRSAVRPETKDDHNSAPIKGVICLSDLVAVKSLSKQIGGLSKLKECVRALEQITT